MKLTYDDITNKHRNEPCIVALHGPSLNPYLDKIQQLQREKGFLRISVNEWYDYFKEKPDYWVVSNTEYTIYNSIAPNWLWDVYNKGRPKDIFNKYNVPLLYNDTADMTDEKFVQENLKCDYLPYDAKHFKNMKCRDILNSFREYYEANRNFDFKEYGNNNEMWQPLSTKGTNCHPVWATFAGAWARDNKCCHKIDLSRATIQEVLQNLSGHKQHMGPPISVGFFALVFAVLMGCNPIYVTGMDLDYAKGYANPEATNRKHHVNIPAIGHWKFVNNIPIKNDFRILKESADLLGTEIINLNKESWFDALPFGDLP
jgi:hypothetical protein